MVVDMIWHVQIFRHVLRNSKATKSLSCADLLIGEFVVSTGWIVLCRIASVYLHTLLASRIRVIVASLVAASVTVVGVIVGLSVSTCILRFALRRILIIVSVAAIVYRYSASPSGVAVVIVI